MKTRKSSVAPPPANLARFIFAAILLCFAAAPQVFAAEEPDFVIYVSPTGDDENDGASAENAKATVDAAYAAAAAEITENGASRAEIRLLRGTHMLVANYLTISLPVTIRAYDCTRDECILRANTALTPRRHFVITGDAEISGLTLADGYYYAQEGGDDNASYNSADGGSIQMRAGTVTNCIFDTCVSYYYGGAVALRGNPASPPKVVDCVMTNCSAYRHGPHGWAVAFTSGDGQDATSAEAPIAALVEKCTILNSHTLSTSSYAYSAVYMNLAGAVLRDCVITGISYHRADWTSVYSGGGVYLVNGLVDRCVITNCVRSTQSIGTGKGGGVYMKGGLLLNSLIAGNEAFNYGGGVYAEGGYVIGNTIADNFCINNSFGGLYVDGSQTVVANNILSYNQKGNTAYPQRNIAFSGINSCKIVDYNCVVPDTAVNSTYLHADRLGANNKFLQPFFSNHQEAPYDYSIANSSPCVDSAATPEMLVAGDVIPASALTTMPFINADFTADLSGITGTRPVQGLASSAEPLPDIGCYEAPDYSTAPLDCSIAADKFSVLIDIPESHRTGGADATNGLANATAEFTFTATLVGSGSENSDAFTYTWSFQDAAGNAPCEPIVSGSPTCTVAFPIGVYDVTLLVQSNIDGKSTSCTEHKFFKVAAPWAYVNLEGRNIAPYWTWEDAAHSVSDALSQLLPEVALADGQQHTIFVAEGTYKLPEMISLTSDVAIIGVGNRDEVIFQAWGASPDEPQASVERRCISINHPNALLAGVTLCNAYSANEQPAAGNLINGTITNCVIRDNSTVQSNTSRNSAAGISMRAGRIVDCAFYDNSPGYAYTHGSLYIADGIVENCVFTNNAGRTWHGAVSVYGGVLRNCIIRGNSVPGWSADNHSAFCAGLYIEGGRAENCVIAENCARDTKGGYSSGVFISGGTLRNCLIYGNTENSSMASSYWDATGVYQRGGTVESCTIINNTANRENARAVYKKSTVAESFRNNIVANNTTTENVFFENASAAACAINCCFFPAPNLEVDASNIIADPLLRDDFSLASASPCCRAGNPSYTWMSDAVDLLGNPRLRRGRSVDIGAVQCYIQRGSFFFLR